MGRVAKDPEIRRKEFIEAARELFTEKGFDKTSVTDITNKVGLSHGSFFYYFKSKNDIMKDVIYESLSQARQLVKHLVDDTEMDALQKFQAILKWAIESNTTQESLIEFCRRDSNAALYREYTLSSRELMTPLYTKIVEQGVKEGLFHVEYPKETIEYFTYIFENLEDSINASMSRNEQYKKIHALEILLTKALGIQKGINLLTEHLTR